MDVVFCAILTCLQFCSTVHFYTVRCRTWLAKKGWIFILKTAQEVQIYKQIPLFISNSFTMLTNTTKFTSLWHISHGYSSVLGIIWRDEVPLQQLSYLSIS